MEKGNLIEKDLVSIIIPCYNGEKYIKKCLNSIMNQTYKKIELIIVNDGSLDNSEQLILEYKDKFKENGMKFIYIKQENQGLGGAINKGLKYFTGEFLCWIDIDDFLSPESIKIRMDFIKEHPQYACVSSNAYVYHEKDMSKPIGLLVCSDIKGQSKENQFKRMIEGKSIFCPGCHLVKTKVFLEVNPNREIYPARRGQNWQMLLPIYYKHKRKFLNLPLYNYVIYESSMSRGDDSKEKKVYRIEEHKAILKNTINAIVDMPIKEKEKYNNYVLKIMNQRILEIAYEYNDKKLYNDTYKELKKMKAINIKYLLKKVVINNDKFNNKK